MIVRPLLTALLLLTPIAALAQAQTFSGTWDGRRFPRSDAQMRSVMMDAHNRERRLYGSTPLVWNEALAENALAYARQLARERRFAHDLQRGAKVRQGENLWMGTREAFPYSQMVGSWIDERKDFRPGRFPDVSRTGNWTVVGHYTQAVWPTTTSIGCGVASNGDDDFLVCRYLPAGNVFGVVMR